MSSSKSIFLSKTVVEQSPFENKAECFFIGDPDSDTQEPVVELSDSSQVCMKRNKAGTGEMPSASKTEVALISPRSASQTEVAVRSRTRSPSPEVRALSPRPEFTSDSLLETLKAEALHFKSPSKRSDLSPRGGSLDRMAEHALPKHSRTGLKVSSLDSTATTEVGETTWETGLARKQSEWENMFDDVKRQEGELLTATCNLMKEQMATNAKHISWLESRVQESTEKIMRRLDKTAADVHEERLQRNSVEERLMRELEKLRQGLKEEAEIRAAADEALNSTLKHDDVEQKLSKLQNEVDTISQKLELETLERKASIQTLSTEFSNFREFHTKDVHDRDARHGVIVRDLTDALGREKADRDGKHGAALRDLTDALGREKVERESAHAQMHGHISNILKDLGIHKENVPELRAKLQELEERLVPTLRELSIKGSESQSQLEQSIFDITTRTDNLGRQVRDLAEMLAEQHQAVDAVPDQLKDLRDTINREKLERDDTSSHLRGEITRLHRDLRLHKEHMPELRGKMKEVEEMLVTALREHRQVLQEFSIERGEGQTQLQQRVFDLAAKVEQEGDARRALLEEVDEMLTSYRTKMRGLVNEQADTAQRAQESFESVWSSRLKDEAAARAGQHEALQGQLTGLRSDVTKLHKEHLPDLRREVSSFRDCLAEDGRDRDEKHEAAIRGLRDIFSREKAERDDGHRHLRGEVSKLYKDMGMHKETLPELRGKVKEMEDMVLQVIKEQQEVLHQLSLEQSEAQTQVQQRISDVSAKVDHEGEARRGLLGDVEEMLSAYRSKMRGLVNEQAEMAQRAQESLESVWSSRLKDEVAARAALDRRIEELGRHLPDLEKLQRLLSDESMTREAQIRAVEKSMEGFDGICQDLSHVLLKRGFSKA